MMYLQYDDEVLELGSESHDPLGLAALPLFLQQQPKERRVILCQSRDQLVEHTRTKSCVVVSTTKIPGQLARFRDHLQRMTVITIYRLQR